MAFWCLNCRIFVFSWINTESIIPTQKYANRIGLTDGNRFLKDNSDIVLDFPFKDCVLNGGQSTEEGEEIYFKRNNSQSVS